MANGALAAFPALAPAPGPVDPGGGTSDVPFPMGSLQAPLSAGERTTVIDFLVKWWKGVPGFTRSDWQKKSDKQLIDVYNATVKWVVRSGRPMQPPSGKADIPGVSSVTDFLNKLLSGSLWVRVAEFAIGGLLVAVGVNAMLKNNPTYRSAKSTAKALPPLAGAAKLPTKPLPKGFGE